MVAVFGYELIGAKAEIIDAKNKEYIGMKGKIKDETRNTLILGKRIIPKKNVKFRFKFEGQTLEIDGSRLLHRPEDRLKKFKVRK